MSRFLVPALGLRRAFFPSSPTSLLASFRLNTSILRTIRRFSETRDERIERTRNIGISAHIDSGKTTLTERILYYSGRISDIHEVRGKDGVGAKMDSMELEREKGITIQSAATYVKWKDSHVNIIDTPGHVDFTIEVERALRVLDGAILVVCGVGGIQSQTYTVDRQMRRYNVPRLAFINKLDRQGADPWKIIASIREKLRLPCSALQIPIGISDLLEGLVDIVDEKAYYFTGSHGQNVKEAEVPANLLAILAEKRKELISALVDADDLFAEKVVLEEQEPTIQDIKDAIRRATIERTFVPVLMGSAYKNKGVQKLLDAVIDYLPNPKDMNYQALDASDQQIKVPVVADSSKPFVGLAFKLDEGRYGQLTYLRVYQGTLTRGSTIFNPAQGKKIKVPRIVRMHSNEMEDVESIGAGEICAMFGVECHSGTTFTAGQGVTMMSMFVPRPVISLSVKAQDKKMDAVFSKALTRFQKEDPTFKVHFDHDSKEIIISGMGELHLFIYTERLKREYGVNVETGRPQVAFRETIQSRSEFSYLHKKQTGGQGQFAKVCGYVEPLVSDLSDYTHSNEFLNEVVGGTIPPEYLTAVEKGFVETVEKGVLTGFPVISVRMVVNDGASHAVDSSDLAFRLASSMAFKQGFHNASPVILEPVMTVNITVPTDFQGTVITGVTKRKGVILNSDSAADFAMIDAEVPLNEMFGYSTELRSQTQGKGEFTMEYLKHAPVSRESQRELIATFQSKTNDRKEG